MPSRSKAAVKENILPAPYRIMPVIFLFRVKI
jgi:hypothetical protein